MREHWQIIAALARNPAAIWQLRAPKLRRVGEYYATAAKLRSGLLTGGNRAQMTERLT
jgi:hypothetical protein